MRLKKCIGFNVKHLHSPNLTEYKTFSTLSQQKVFPKMHSRISGKYWRDLPKAKASVLIAIELGFSNVSGDSVKVSEITDEKKTANFSARIVSAFEVK